MSKQSKIVVVDYGVGNCQSVGNALERLGYDFIVSSQEQDIRNADAYIMPGVGAFGEAMRNLRSLNMIGVLKDEVCVKKKPLLGICLGMQLLATDSTENGFHQGLNWIEGHIVHIEGHHVLRVPHVGWNSLCVKKQDPLFNRTQEDHCFYFDHSFHFDCDNAYVSATCDYGVEFIVAVQKDNIFGVQFHPEKSQSNGLKLFRCFLNYVEDQRGTLCGTVKGEQDHAS